MSKWKQKISEFTKIECREIEKSIEVQLREEDEETKPLPTIEYHDINSMDKEDDTRPMPIIRETNSKYEKLGLDDNTTFKKEEYKETYENNKLSLREVFSNLKRLIQNKNLDMNNSRTH